MGDYTYDTDHGHFHMTEAKAAEAYEALRRSLLDEFGLSEEGWLEVTDFDSLLMCFRLGVERNENREVVDISLVAGHYDESCEGKALKAIAPYVTSGSFLVYYGGGSSGCWALAFDADPETKEVCFHEMDVLTVLAGDFAKILCELHKYGAPCYNQMRLKYLSNYTANAKEPDGS